MLAGNTCTNFIVACINAHQLEGTKKMDFTMKLCFYVAVFGLATFTLSKANSVTVPPTALLWAGDNAALSCQVTSEEILRRVVWTIGTTRLAEWTPGDGVQVPSEPEKYSMSSGYMLYIYNVSRSDAANYTCGGQFEDKSIMYDTTDVTVYDEPDEPYPSIVQYGCDSDCNCAKNATDDANYHIDVANETDTVNITCKASHYYPALSLTWTVGGVSLDPTNVKYHNNSDGTSCAEVTVTVGLSDKEYVCTAKGKAVRVGQRSSKVWVTLRDDMVSSPKPTHDDAEPSGGGSVGLWVGIAIICVVGILVTIFVVYKLKFKRDGGGKKGTNKYSYKGVSGDKSVENADEEMASKATPPKKPQEDNFNITEINEESQKLQSQPVYKDDKSDKVDVVVTVGSDGGGGGD